MNQDSLTYFEALKQQVVATFKQNYAASNDISEWKGETIVLFQEDLFERTKAKVSEKWFYTYFKNTPEKLPRIDMLNILCNYVGEENWDSFKATQVVPSKGTSSKKLSKILMALAFVPLAAYVFFSGFMNSSNEFKFCFIDEDKREAIKNTELDIKVLRDDESPIYLKTDPSGCFSFESKNEYIQFVVSSPYYKTDTIYRHINSHHDETVRVKVDDHALMLHYLQMGDKAAWEQHRKELSKLFADNAKIYQVYPNSMNVEFYSREDFIDKLSLPTKGLKNIEILKKVYKNNQITLLKFIVR